MTRTARVYKIEQLIKNRGHVSRHELIEELEVSHATLKRDLEYLRDRLGAPIEYDRFVNGYRFGAGFRGERHELPGLWFSERELYALLMANQLLGELDAEGIISRHLQPLLERIHQMLGGEGDAAQWLLDRVKIARPARRAVAARFFERVGEALVKRRRLRMTYLTRRRGETSEREISPQRLVHYRNTWYVDAWCHSRDRLLRFALDAIEAAEVSDTKAKTVSLRQLRAAMDGGYGAYAGARAHWVTLRFAPQAALWVSREEWHPRQQGEHLADGSWRLKLPYTDPTELAMDILRHAGEVTIEADTGEVALRVGERLRMATAMLATPPSVQQVTATPAGSAAGPRAGG